MGGEGREEGGEEMEDMEGRRRSSGLTATVMRGCRPALLLLPLMLLDRRVRGRAGPAATSEGVVAVATGKTPSREEEEGAVVVA